MASTSHVCVVCKISYQVKPELLLFPMSNKGLGKKGNFDSNYFEYWFHLRIDIHAM